MASENEIQNYLWEQREHWTDFIDPAEIPEPYKFAADLSDVTAERLLFNRTMARLDNSDSYVRGMILFGCEVALTKEQDSTIRADFLGANTEEAGIGIIELKKPDTSSEREAFTQLLGYSSHLSTVFPMMCRNDIVYVLIAPMQSRIVREAFLSSLLLDNKRVYALQPVLADGADLATLRLQPWIPPQQDFARLADAVFGAKNFRLWKLVWENREGVWNVAAGVSQATEEIRLGMNRISAYASQLMEAAGIHGFTFCSQSWPELQTVFGFTNSLVIVGLNPYEVGHDLYLRNEQNVPDEELFTTHSEYFNLSDLLPGLKNNTQEVHETDNFLQYLSAAWDDHLLQIAKKVLQQALRQTAGGTPKIDYFTIPWEDYQRLSVEDVCCENFDVRPTGIMRQLFWDITMLDYDVAIRDGLKNHPIHGDMLLVAAETLSDHGYFRAFLERLCRMTLDSDGDSQN